MTEISILLPLLFLTLSVLSLFTYFLWHSVKLSWVYVTTYLVIFALPFERIPTIEIGEITVRFSQLLTLFGLYLVFLLFLKKDAELYKLKFNKYTNWFLFFLVFSIPSWFLAINFTKLSVSLTATFLVFGTFFLVSNFTKNIKKAFLVLISSFSIVGLFSVWQFIGGMLSFPTWSTGLIEHYTTKEVFGFPRLQATFLEPLYFAGGLFIPIFIFLFLAISNTNIFKDIPEIQKFPRLQKSLQFVKKNHNNISYFSLFFFSILFLLTISKGAWLTLFITGFLAITVSIKYLNVRKFLSLTSKMFLLFLFILLLLLNFSSGAQDSFDRTYSEIIRTIEGDSVTASERMDFINAGVGLIKSSPVFGVGAGNYGSAANYMLNHLRLDTSGLIANNIYVEVWAEYGFLSYLVFLLVFLSILYTNFRSINFNNIKEEDLFKIILGFILLSYLIQWNTFSPIYITPIFIILGLLVKLNQKNEKYA